MPEPTHSHFDEMALHEYLDEVLDLAARAEIEAHLAGCPTCAVRLAELQALFTALESLPEVLLEHDLAPAVLEAIRPARTTPPALRWAVIAQLAAAVALLIFAWPRVAGQFAGLAGGQMRVQVIGSLANALRVLFAQWPALFVPARGLSVPSLGVTRYAPALHLSPLSWWLLIAAALVLWLAGNGLLLRLFGEN